jgi:hypothetical protein
LLCFPPFSAPLFRSPVDTELFLTMNQPNVTAGRRQGQRPLRGCYAAGGHKGGWDSSIFSKEEATLKRVQAL